MGHTFTIIGAGMSGILAAIKLREAGFEDITIYEKADRIGGTWRDNNYPGLTCDVPAHCYTYAFARNPDWSAYHAPGPEIQDYFEKIVDDYGVRSLIRFNSEVKRLEWDRDHYIIETADGECSEAQFVIAATGVLHYPKWPDVPGLNSFSGPAMHSARWDTSVDLTGKRIGIIGNGSTGIQMATRLGLDGHDVVHFQRSPQWIMPVPTFAYSDEDRARFRENPEEIEAIVTDPEFIDSVNRFTTGIADANSPEMQAIEDYCRANLEQSVTDPELRQKLTPTYKAACKRLVYSATYYEAAQKPNVQTIVCGIDKVVPDGVIDKDGKHHHLDVLAFATGFHTDRFIRPTLVKGVDGIDLEDVWEERCKAYYAISIPSFPNFFMINGPSSPVGNFSLIDVAERQWVYIKALIEETIKSEADGIAASEGALAAFEEKRIAAARNSVFGSGCTSWYLDKTGVPISWPWAYDKFIEAMREPRFEDYELIGAKAA